MQRISSFHSPAEARESAPIFSTHSNLEKNQTGKGNSVPKGSQQLWKQVTAPKTAKFGVICTSWYLISAEQDNLDPVRVNPEGTRQSCGDRDSTADTQIPWIQECLWLQTSPLSQFPQSAQLVGTHTRSFPSPAQGGKGKAHPCQVPVLTTPTTVSQPLYPTGSFPLHRKQQEKKKQKKPNNPQTTAGNSGREMLRWNPCMQVWNKSLQAP